jgi:D-alanine-D-alanine ligase
LAPERRDLSFNRILIVFNRPAPERTASAARFGRLARLLTEAGYEAFLEPADSIASFSAAIASNAPDIVFSAADHLSSGLPAWDGGAPGLSRSINVHSWLEDLGIPYVGSPPEVIDLALSKSALKERWMQAGISTPEFIAADMRDGGVALAALTAAPLPCIVKPVDAGNSRGIGKDSVAHDRSELAALAARVGREYPAILVERYLGEFPDFREFTCACIGNGAARRFFPAEIVFAGETERRIVTTEDKDGLKARARRIGDEALADEVTALAARAFEAAGVRDYSRCDLILAGGKLWAIEVNGQPMIPDPWFQACAEFGGLSEPAYIEAIFAAAIARFLPGIERFRPEKEGA